MKIIILALVILGLTLGGVYLYNYVNAKSMSEYEAIIQGNTFALKLMLKKDKNTNLGAAIFLGKKDIVEDYIKREGFPKHSVASCNSFSRSGISTQAASMRSNVFENESFGGIYYDSEYQVSGGYSSTRANMSYLYIAAISNQIEIVKMFLGFGEYVNNGIARKNFVASPIAPSNNCNFETSLMGAVQKGHKEMAQLLLEKNADVNYEDLYGNTALDYAQRNGNKEIEKLLLKYGAKEGAHLFQGGLPKGRD